MSFRKCFTGIVVLLTICQFITLFIFNLTQSECILDYDSALVFRQMVEMWKNGTIFVENYEYTTSLAIDCAFFFAAPIYLLTSHFGFSVALVHAFFALLFSLVILDLFHNMGRELWEACVGILLVFSPYSITVSANNLEYNNMLFCNAGQYELRVLTLLLLLDLLVCQKKSGKRYFWGALYFCFLFWTSFSTGTYLFMMGLIPIFLVVVLEQLIRQKLSLLSYEMRLMWLSMAVSLLGILLNANSVVGVSPRNSLYLIAAARFIAHIGECLVGIFLLVQGMPILTQDVPLLSLRGIVLLLKMLLVIFSLLIPIIAGVKYKAWEKISVFKYAAGVALVNIAVLLVTDSQYGSYIFEARYHLLWFVVMLVILPTLMGTIVGAWNNSCLLKSMMIAFVAGIFVVNLYGYGKGFCLDNPYYDRARQVVALSDELDMENVFLYNGEGEEAVVDKIVRALDVHLNCLSISRSDESYVFDLYGFYCQESAQVQNIGENMLLIREEDFYTLPERIQESYQWYSTVEELSVYISSENLW